MSNINFTGLLTVVKTNNYEKVKFFLEKQGLKENNHRNNCLALHHAIREGHLKIVKILLDYGCLADEPKADFFYTSLDYAAKDEEMLRLLLKAGASTAGKDFKQQTPLIRAMNKNYLHAVDTMLSCYDVESIDPTNKNEIIHFTIAGMRSNSNLVGCFIQKGLHVNSILSHYYDDWTGYTPLHCAVTHVSVAGAKILLEYGADMTIQDDNGYSPLHLAYYALKDTAYRVELNRIIYLILSAHKSVVTNPIDRNGASHLHIACTRSHKPSKEFLKILLEANFDVKAEDKFGQTALSLAAVNNNAEAVIMLLNYGADINKSSVQNVSLLRQVKQRMLLAGKATSAVFEILSKHVRKLSFIGYPVSLEDLQVCAASAEVTLKELRELSKERQTLKEKKIDLHTSLYDILFKTKQQMTRHVRNENFKKELTAIVQLNAFPNYGYLLHLNYREGLARNQILDHAERSLRLLMKRSLPDSCVDSIFDYLTNTDLKNVISVAG